MGKSRWPSWVPVPNKPTVSVDVKQHSTNQPLVKREFQPYDTHLNRKVGARHLQNPVVATLKPVHNATTTSHVKALPEASSTSPANLLHPTPPCRQGTNSSMPSGNQPLRAVREPTPPCRQGTNPLHPTPPGRQGTNPSVLSGNQPCSPMRRTITI